MDKEELLKLCHINEDLIICDHDIVKGEDHSWIDKCIFSYDREALRGLELMLIERSGANMKDTVYTAYSIPIEENIRLFIIGYGSTMYFTFDPVYNESTTEVYV
jgi:hypothetical protein